MNNDIVDADAKTVWDYLQLHQTIKQSDAIFVLCSMDTRVAEYAAKLFNQGLAEYLIISGGAGKLTKGIFNRPEAQVFRDIALAVGVPAAKIIIEDKSTNTGENVRFTYNLLQAKGFNPNSMILVQKPYMERRTYATFMKQWPGKSVDICITSPQLSYDEYPNDNCPRNLILNVMVGDMQRIKEYAKLGLQINQDIPDNVWQAYERLVEAGFTTHLLR